MVLSLLKFWLCLLSILGYSFNLRKHFHQRIGFALILSVSAICSLSYIFSVIFENIIVPIKFFYFLGLILLTIFLWSCVIKKDDVNQKKLLLDTILSPLAISFLIAATVIYLIYYPNAYLDDWDEFTCWGISVKNIYIQGRLLTLSSIKSGISTCYYPYPPATAIFFYFFLSNINQQFSETTTLFANSILLILPVYYCLDWIVIKNNNLRKWVVIFLTSIILVILYIILVLGYKFSTIYVDLSLGSYFGIIAAHSFFYQRNNNAHDKNVSSKNNFIFFNIFLFFVTFFVVLIKDFGLFFATLPIPLLWLNYHRQQTIEICRVKLDYWSRNIISSFVAIASILIARLSWQKVITGNVLSIFSLFTAKLSNGNHKIELFSFNNVQLKIIKAYFNNWVAYFHLFTECLVLKILFLISLILLLLIHHKEVRIKIIQILIYSGGIYLLYSSVLGWCYLTKFSEYEALYSASCTRYLSSAVIGCIIILLTLIFNVISTNELRLSLSLNCSEKYDRLKILLLTYLIILFVILAFEMPTQIIKQLTEVEFGIKNTQQQTRVLHNYNRIKIKSEADQILPYLKAGKKVLPLFHNFTLPQCYVLNYELSPYFQMKTMYSCEALTRKIYFQNTIDQEKRLLKIPDIKFSTYDLFENKVVQFDLIEELKNYDLLFIPRADKELWNNIGYIFDGDYQHSKFFVLNSKGKLEPKTN